MISDEGIRINKFIGSRGITSRRQADLLVEQGKVLINGKVAVLGDRVLPGDEVSVRGKILKEGPKRVYLAYNKPAGVETTTNRKVNGNIIDAIDYPERIFPIGRLDKASTGLIFLTNDGDIVNKILRASYGHEKEYRVTVNKPINQDFIRQMSQGVPILDTVTKEAVVRQTGPMAFTIILTQGLNRQIRRMCEYLGYRVLTLHRVRIMNVNIGGLKSGHWRNLTAKELKEIEARTQDE